MRDLEVAGMGVLTGLLGEVNGILYGWVLCFLLVGAGLWFTWRTRAVQVRLFRRMIMMITRSSDDAKDGISSFQAFAVGLASRTGTGNTAGVAIALTLGGPGAIFWMWCVAALSMATAFVEATLAQIFKVRGADGGFVGGPAYYIQRGLGSRRWGLIFAVLLLIAFGFAFNMVQANAISEVLWVGHGIPPWSTAVVLVVLAAPILFGGVQRVARLSGATLPWIAFTYLGIALVVVVMNIDQLPGAIALIVRSAFGLDPAVAGVTGGLLAAMINGIKRGLFSNEGGMGSAPNAAATATVSHPTKQGLLQSLGVFIDTMVICSATAFLILVSGPEVYDPTFDVGAAGGALTTQAVVANFGSWATTLMTAMIFLFAFTSILGNYSYAEVNVRFLGGGPRSLTGMRLTVLGAVALGALVELETAWAVADIAMALMAMVNLVAIIRLAPWALGALRDWEDLTRRGAADRFVGERNAHLPGDVPGDVWTERDRTPAP